MYRLLHIGGPLHGKRTGPLAVLPVEVPVLVVEREPCCPMHARMVMRIDAYGVLPTGRFHTEWYETRIAILHGREVPYLSYQGVV